MESQMYPLFVVSLHYYVTLRDVLCMESQMDPLFLFSLQYYVTLKDAVSMELSNLSYVSSLTSDTLLSYMFSKR